METHKSKQAKRKKKESASAANIGSRRTVSSLREDSQIREENSSIPEEDSSIKEEVSSIHKDVSTIREESLIREENSSYPEEDSSIKEEVSSICEDSLIREENSSIPEEDSSLSEEDSSLSEEDSSISEDGPPICEVIAKVISPEVICGATLLGKMTHVQRVQRHLQIAAIPVMTQLWIPGTRDPDTGGPSRTHIAELPESCLLRVFFYLDEAQLGRVARTCTTWRRIAYDCSLWTRVDLRRYQDKIDELRLTKIIQSRMSPLLYKLNLSGLTLSPRVFRLLAKECKKLRVLSLESSTFVEQFEDAVNSFPRNLDYLDIRHTTGDKSAFKIIALTLQGVRCLGLNDEIIKSSQDKSENLEKMFSGFSATKILEFSYCTKLSDDMVGHLAAFGLRLESLCLRRCNSIIGKSLPLLINSCTLLTSLVLDGTSIDDDALMSVPWENSIISDVDLSWCRHLTEVGLCAILPKLSRLRYLRIVFIVANFPMEFDKLNNNMIMKSAVNSCVDRWPTPMRMRKLALESVMSWK
ncbi:predicted protein [Nematostella vectensis]|uniref:F-box domain-containing protein n=1 Tax=Nematostella vectensis TaxID=45351 RepID=A7T6D4_NEMVE|nr:predicted protein [Nematostella vectensis]|eukprot:XP_001620571.1 hypothetical protein NEMVEDRAFT_v1g222971 [Nematostella vectensis]